MRPIHDASQERKSAAGFRIAFGGRRKRIEIPRFTIQFGFNGAESGIEEAQKTIREVGADGFFAEHRRQIAAQANARKFDLDAVEAGRHLAVAAKFESQPEKTAAAAAHQTVPLAADHFGRRLVGFPDVAQILDVVVGQLASAV